MPPIAPFTLTVRAIKEIKSLLEKYERTYSRRAIPALMWVDAALNQGVLAESGIAIGFYTDRDEIEKGIVLVDELEVVLAVSQEDESRFLGSTIDFRDDIFRFD